MPAVPHRRVQAAESGLWWELWGCLLHLPGPQSCLTEGCEGSVAAADANPGSVPGVVVVMTAIASTREVLRSAKLPGADSLWS